MNIKDVEDNDYAPEDLEVGLNSNTIDEPINKLINYYDFKFMELSTINHPKERAEKVITINNGVRNTLLTTETRDPREIAEEAKG